MALKRRSGSGNIFSRLSDPRYAKAAWLEMLQEDPEKVWPMFANHMAKAAHQRDFPTRSGYYVLNGFPTATGEAICLFNNNPDRGHGNTVDNRRRDKEIDQFRARMIEAGITELGFGTYPLPGEKQAGYTYAILLDAGQAQLGTLLDAISDAKREAWEWYATSVHKEADEYAAVALPPSRVACGSEAGEDFGDDDVDEPVAETPATPRAIKVGETSQLRQVRIGQDAFSRAVRDNYGHRCCFPGCEVDHDDLLVAAHIVRWADEAESRGDIANGLCLCGLHDKAFESGLFTLTDELCVAVNLQKAASSRWVENDLQRADGQEIRTGRIRPSVRAIRHHRERHRR